jgi:hypothetical protein
VVRRASRQPNRLGFAIPGEWRISVTAYRGSEPATRSVTHGAYAKALETRAGARAGDGSEQLALAIPR